MSSTSRSGGSHALGPDHADEGHDQPRRQPDGHADRHDVVERERAEHGGIKWGSAFFGWLTATGTAVLVTALLSALGAAVGLGVFDDSDQAQSQARQSADTVGLVGGVALVAILLVAYFCGGYVAGRMARFDGARQGLAVWLWAVVIAVAVAVVAAVAGSQYNILSQLNSLPRIPVGEGTLVTGGVITAVAAVLASLAGAVLGGLAGMRFHRKVDRTGLS
jgi:hypothetical protein